MSIRTSCSIPTASRLGNVNQGEGAEGKIIVYRAGRIDWKILEAKTANPYLSCKVVERARQDNQVWYELQVRLAKNAPCGCLQDHVILLTNDPQVTEIPVTVEAQVLAKVNVQPAVALPWHPATGREDDAASGGVGQEAVSHPFGGGRPGKFPVRRQPTARPSRCTCCR